MQSNARGSVTRRKRTRKDGTSFVVLRAQVPDPRKPASAQANIEKVFSAPAYGGIASARKAANKWVRAQLDAIQKDQWRAGDAGDLALAEVISQWHATWPHKLAPKTHPPRFTAVSAIQKSCAVWVNAAHVVAVRARGPARHVSPPESRTRSRLAG
jgi:hypothetical protein